MNSTHLKGEDAFEALFSLIVLMRLQMFYKGCSHGGVVAFVAEQGVGFEASWTLQLVCSVMCLSKMINGLM